MCGLVLYEKLFFESAGSCYFPFTFDENRRKSEKERKFLSAWTNGAAILFKMAYELLAVDRISVDGQPDGDSGNERREESSHRANNQ